MGPNGQVRTQQVSASGAGNSVRYCFFCGPYESLGVLWASVGVLGGPTRARPTRAKEGPQGPRGAHEGMNMDSAACPSTCGLQAPRIFYTFIDTRVSPRLSNYVLCCLYIYEYTFVLFICIYMAESHWWCVPEYVQGSFS